MFTMTLCYRFAVLHSKVDGTCLIKLWSGKKLEEFDSNVKKFYGNVKLVKPPSSRSDSAEIYVLARNFKGIKENGGKS